MIVLNPAFHQWRHLDQARVGWILSSISPKFHTFKSSHRLYLQSALEQFFSTQSKAKIMRLKIQFQTTKKDSLSIKFSEKIQNIANSLTMAGYSVSDEDFIMQLLASLPLHYDVILANIHASLTTMTVKKVQSLLLSQEAWIQQATSPEIISTNIAMKQPKRSDSGQNFNLVMP